MKKHILYLFTLAALATACNNNNNKTSENQQDSAAYESMDGAPVMKFEKDVYEFGTITEGQKVAYDFVFENKGESPLIIKNAAASCGCTVPEWPKDPILPGEKGKINVVFNSAGKSGLQDKVVTITANTVPAETQIHLIGEINK